MNKLLILTSLSSALFLTACGGGSDDSSNDQKPEQPKPTEYIPSQYKTLNDNFNYVKDPLTEIKSNNLYNISYWVDEKPVSIYNYNYLYQSSLNTFKTKFYSTSSPSSNIWKDDPQSNLLFNVTQNKWVETQNDLTITEGPVGTEGIKSLYIQSDTGVKYYTLTEKDLSGLSIDQGLNQGFGNGIPLPDSVKTQYFSAGAKAYAWVQDITQQNYLIRRTHYVFSTQNEVHPINTCTNIGSCSSTASTLEKAIENKAWYRNIGQNGSIRLNNNQIADLVVYDDIQKKNLNYTIKYELITATQGVPKHILFTASDTVAKEALKTYFSAGDNQIAWYEYNNQVVEGQYALPIKGLQSTQYSYNKTAVNDILTKWNPKKNPVLE